MFANTLQSAEVKMHDVKVTSIFPISLDRVAAPSSQGFTRIFFDAGSWEPSSDCRNSAADISHSDTHIFSSLLSAIALNKEIIVRVESTLTPIDNVCQVANIQVML